MSWLEVRCTSGRTAPLKLPDMARNKHVRLDSAVYGQIMAGRQEGRRCRLYLAGTRTKPDRWHWEFSLTSSPVVWTV